jgi:hypothetical protein
VYTLLMEPLVTTIVSLYFYPLFISCFIIFAFMCVSCIQANLSVMELLNYLKKHFPEIYKRYSYSNMFFNTSSSMAAPNSLLQFLRSDEIDKLHDSELIRIKNKTLKYHNKMRNLFKWAFIVFSLLFASGVLLTFLGSKI